MHSQTMQHDAAAASRQLQGQRIRAARLARGLTLARLAADIGVTAGAVSQWETGATSPRLGMSYAIAEALGTDHRSLFADAA